jgi:hypothetical protein
MPRKKSRHPLYQGRSKKEWVLEALTKLGPDAGYDKAMEYLKENKVPAVHPTAFYRTKTDFRNGSPAKNGRRKKRRKGRRRAAAAVAAVAAPAVLQRAPAQSSRTASDLTDCQALRDFCDKRGWDLGRVSQLVGVLGTLQVALRG